jgi:hypothetical protein
MICRTVDSLKGTDALKQLIAMFRDRGVFKPDPDNEGTITCTHFFNNFLLRAYFYRESRVSLEVRNCKAVHDCVLGFNDRSCEYLILENKITFSY